MGGQTGIFSQVGLVTVFQCLRSQQHRPEKSLDPGARRGENKATIRGNQVALAGTVLCSLHDSHPFPTPRLSVLLLFSGGAADSHSCPACHGGGQEKK